MGSNSAQLFSAPSLNPFSRMCPQGHAAVSGDTVSHLEPGPCMTDETVNESVIPGSSYQPMTRVVAALFVIATVWKQHRCPPTDEWIQEVVVHMYNEILLSYKKECI